MAAMELQLRHVLAGLAARRRKPERQRLVDHLTALRLAHARQRRRRAGGTRPISCSSATRARGPQRRMTATAAGGRPDESAKMVGRSFVTLSLRRCSGLSWGLGYM